MCITFQMVFFVCVPNRKMLRAQKIGGIKLGPNLFLKDVFYIPEFYCNLISIGQLGHDLHCCITFFSNICISQDLASKRPIGVGELRNRVYHLRSVLHSQPL